MFLRLKWFYDIAIAVQKNVEFISSGAIFDHTIVFWQVLVFENGCNFRKFFRLSITEKRNGRNKLTDLVELLRRLGLALQSNNAFLAKI